MELYFQDVTKAARRLAVNVIEQCAEKLEPGIKDYLLSLMSGDSKPGNGEVQYHGVIYDLYCCAPQVLSGFLPYLTRELMVISYLLASIEHFMVSNFGLYCYEKLC